MKKLLPILFIILLLAGCNISPESSQTAVTSSLAAPTVSSVPAASVLPESSPESTSPQSATAALDASAGTFSPGDVVPADLLGSDLEEWFSSFAIDDAVLNRISGISYPEDCPIPLSRLRYIRVLHIGFDGEAHIGELIVNQTIETPILEIFRQLYEAGYPIEKMLLIDTYGGDDEASMTDNNTSCFNYRTMAGSSKMSSHSQGLALDINPLYNPYVKTKDDHVLCQPAAAEAYIDRSGDFSHKIVRGDLCYELFSAYGFQWGGDWTSVQDYQHFEYWQ